MPQCRLCHQEAELRESHILPKFLYQSLLNNNRQIMAITGHGHRGWKPLQDGEKENLFCERCEQHFNQHFEKPFRELWLETKPLPNPWSDSSARSITVDYSTFKLFHLSVLYRASVTSLPTFDNVELGAHTEKIRKLLLNRDPGKFYEYPVAGYAVVHHNTRELIQMISKPQAFRIGGLRCYGIMYGGVEWWTSVSTARNPEFEQFALKGNGQISFSVFPWQEVAVVQEASWALRNADT